MHHLNLLLPQFDGPLDNQLKWPYGYDLVTHPLAIGMYSHWTCQAKGSFQIQSSLDCVAMQEYVPRYVHIPATVVLLYTNLNTIFIQIKSVYYLILIQIYITIALYLTVYALGQHAITVVLSVVLGRIKHQPAVA